MHDQSICKEKMDETVVGVTLLLTLTICKLRHNKKKQYDQTPSRFSSDKKQKKVNVNDDDDYDADDRSGEKLKKKRKAKQCG